jgi:hypothetical protein
MASFEYDAPEILEDDGDAPADFVMGDEQQSEVVEADPGATQNGEEDAFVQEEEAIPERVTFIDYLKTPIVELLIGQGEHQTLLTAHQALLVQSPFFEDACSQFSENAFVRASKQPIWI